MSLKELKEGSVVAAADIVVAVAWDGDPFDVAAVVAAKPNKTELKFKDAIVAVVAAAVAVVGEAVAVVGEGGTAGVALGALGETVCQKVGFD